MESLPMGRVVKATTTPQPNPKPSQPVTEAPSQPKVPAKRKTAGPKKLKPKSTAATKPAAGKIKKKAAARVKTAASKQTTPEQVVPTQYHPPSQSRKSMISSISCPSKHVWN
jgi:hypothetical protein